MGEWKGFNVAGVWFDSLLWKKTKRIEIVKNYVGHGTKFAFVRELNNEYDENAIRIDIIFQSGKSVDIGYVPQGKKKLADTLAPILDTGGKFEVKFGRKFINEKTLQCTGISLRYKISEN